MSQYILWNPESDLPPQVRFADLKSAQDAAVKMANRYPGQRFNVCQLLHTAFVDSPVRFEWYDKPEEKLCNAKGRKFRCTRTLSHLGNHEAVANGKLLGQWSATPSALKSVTAPEDQPTEGR